MTPVTASCATAPKASTVQSQFGSAAPPASITSSMPGVYDCVNRPKKIQIPQVTDSQRLTSPIDPARGAALGCLTLPTLGMGARKGQEPCTRRGHNAAHPKRRIIVSKIQPEFDEKLKQLEREVAKRDATEERDEVRFLCPSHDDHHPSARWNPEKMVWRCDSCGAGGGWKDLYRRLGLGEPGVPGGYCQVEALTGRLHR